jgi:putative ABC transport system permease protein
MKLANIAHLYVVRLKARVVLVQELFAVLGIAVGVALLFASQVASTSLDGSVSQLTDGLVGQSKYQLKARGTQGFGEALFGEVKRLPGVSAAVPVLEQEANVTGAAGSRSVDLIATDPRYVHLAGPLLQHFRASQLARQRAIALPAPIAEAIGAGPLEVVKLQIGARVVRALVGTELNARSIGPLVNSPVAIAPLAYVQKLAGMQGKITRIFVQVQPGRDREVQAGLSRLAAGHLNVEPGNFEATLFSQAAGPINQTTILFSTICALVGFMFAYCSMLLTTQLRRGLIDELRRIGTTRWGAVKALLFDALVLGGVASLLGLALGELLSIIAFHANAGYLSFAFPVGSQRIVTWQSVVIAIGTGMLAACIGVLTPLRDVWTRARRARSSSEPSPFGAWKIGMLAGGLACLGITTAVLLTGARSVQITVVGVVSLIAALLLLLPLLIEVVVAAFDALQRPAGTGSGEFAVLELRAPAIRARSIAIAATGAIAVFGGVAIQGAKANLQHGLDRLVHQLSVVADVWVIPSGKQDLLATTPFRGVSSATLADIAGVKAVGVYRASFLEYGGRRVWVLAPPATASSPVPSSQIVTGNLALANARLHAGGWAVISKTLATEFHLHIGQTFTLPSPRETKFRVAALTTNLGWPPGAIILNGDDYVRAWESSEPSAYNVMLSPGASSTQVRREIQRALGPQSGLTVQTARQREQTQQAASHQGLGRLSQITLLVLIAGILATATSMSAMIWQRRRGFARMKVLGYDRRVLWLALIYESALLLGAGCSIGALFGVYSELLQSHALATVTGFPIVISVQALVALGSFALVTAVAVAIVAVPGYRVASVPPYPWSEV